MDNSSYQKRAGFTLIELMIVVAIIGILATLTAGIVTRGRYEAKLAGMGYDTAEVRVFLKGTDFDAEDLYASEGLKRQFEAFRKGETASGFMAEARLKHLAAQAKASTSAWPAAQAQAQAAQMAGVSMAGGTR